MIKVLQIGMYESLGGIETYLYNYYKNIDKNKVQFDFINMHRKICFQDELIKLGANIYTIENVKKNPYKCYKQMCKVMKENNYEIVHINMLSAANIVPLIAAKKAKVKNILVHSHNANTPKGIVKKIMHKVNKSFIKKHSDYYLACSKLAGRWLFGDDIVKNEKFKVINNAINIENFLFNKNIREKVRSDLNLDENIVLGHVGRFSEQKNHLFLIDVFNEIYKRSSDYVLLLIGTGELEARVKDKVNELNLQNNVIFLGVCSDVNNYYQAMDIFILPSLFEGLPLVGIEAQVSGTKCIFSSEITEEVKIAEESEFISLSSSANYWAEKILSGYKKNDKSINNQKFRESRYNINQEVKRLEEFYSEIVK